MFYLKSAILDQIQTAGADQVWVPSDFAALGTRDAIDKTLQRMVAAGELRRIDLGLTDAIPAKVTVHTDSRRRSLKLGNLEI
jgi:hypothetical protein